MFGDQLKRNKELLPNLEVFEVSADATKVLCVDGIAFCLWFVYVYFGYIYFPYVKNEFYLIDWYSIIHNGWVEFQNFLELIHYSSSVYFGFRLKYRIYDFQKIYSIFNPHFQSFHISKIDYSYIIPDCSMSDHHHHAIFFSHQIYYTF